MDKATATRTVDSDGIPPGMNPQEIPLIGKVADVFFSGNFYAADGKYCVFCRRARLVYVLRETAVLQDTETKNIYVISRKEALSQGCLMSAKIVIDGEELTYGN